VSAEMRERTYRVVNPRKGKNPSGEEIPGFRVLDVKDGMIVDALAQCRYLQCVK